MRPEILYPLFAPIGALKGVGPRLEPILQKIAGPIARDLIFLAPTGIIQRPVLQAATAADGAIGVFKVQIEAVQPALKPSAPTRIRAFDGSGWITLVFFRAGKPITASLPIGAERWVSGKIERFGSEIQIVHPDYIVPLDRAEEIPRFETVYPAAAGVTSRQVRKVVHAALARAMDLPEWLDPALTAREQWPTWRQAIDALHSPQDEADLQLDAPARRRLAYDELLAHQLALQARKSAHQRPPGQVLSDAALAAKLRNALPFQLTSAQARALSEIESDMASGVQMNRLLQGDVGSGKTAVALLAMAVAAGSGRQSALMAPTEILARQHYERNVDLAASLGIDCVMLTGRDKGAGRAEKLARIANGSAAWVIGTHALFQDEVAFQQLGLCVIDEQHRFGVNQRRRLMEKGLAPHLLSMSATPIPRSLALTRYGELDVSNLTEKPPGRRPVATAVLPAERLGEIVARLDKALKDGAQAYWICPLVEESELIDLAAAVARADDLKRALGREVGLVHGRMNAAEKDETMSRFAGGELPLLVATTVVEVGVDVPRASIMVIEHAERFGLAQLHQLRGRVGRGAAASSCILLYAPPLSAQGKARLAALRDTEDGFEIAERDWALRGEGDMLGLRQSGFPAYRLADPIAHQGLLLTAAKDASALLGRDPELKSPRGEAVRVLKALFDWTERSDAALD